MADVFRKEMENGKRLERIIELLESDSQTHNVALTTLAQNMSDMQVRSRAEETSTSIPAPTSKPGAAANYYYGQWAVKTYAALYGCVIYHLDCISARAEFLLDSESKDSSYMDAKAWGSLVSSLVLGVGDEIKYAIRLPKPSDTDYRAAAEIVCSRYVSQSPTCSAAHVRRLVSDCPEIMSSAHTLIQAFVKCQGSLSVSRARRLSSLRYPFVSQDDELLTDEDSKCRPFPESLHSRFKDLKAEEKKVYFSLTYSGTKPPIALNKIKTST